MPSADFVGIFLLWPAGAILIASSVCPRRFASPAGRNAAAGNNTPTSTAVDRAPAVAAVYVVGSTWDPTFRTALGNTAFGYQILTGANQLNTLPWAGIDRVSIRFTENVNVAAGDLQVRGA